MRTSDENEPSFVDLNHRHELLWPFRRAQMHLQASPDLTVLNWLDLKCLDEINRCILLKSKKLSGAEIF